MTVQELINELLEVADKTKQVKIRTETYYHGIEEIYETHNRQGDGREIVAITNGFGKQMFAKPRRLK